MRRLRRLGRAVEVLRPRCEPLLDLRLRRRQRLGERRDDLSLTVGELAATLLRDLALFLDEHRYRVGARARKRPLELFGAVRGFLVDERVQLRLCLDQVRVDGLGAAKRCAQSRTAAHAASALAVSVAAETASSRSCRRAK